MTASPTEETRPTVPIGLLALLVAGATVIAMAGIQSIASIVAPAFFGITMVVTARPLVTWLRKYLHLPGWLATTLTLLAIYVVLLSILGGIAYGVAETGRELPRYSGTFQQMYTDVLAWLAGLGFEVANIETYLADFDFNQILGVVSGLANALTSGTSQAVLFVVITAFIGFDTIRVSGRLESLREAAPYLAESLTGFSDQVRKYWIVSTVFGAIVAVLDGIALMLLDVPLAWTFALFAFVTNYIPNIGFFIGLLPPALLGLLDGGLTTMIWVIVLYTVINNGFQTFIQPKVTGDAVGLNSSVTFVSLVFWTTIVGPLGAILAVPLTLFAKAVIVDSDPRTRFLNVFLQSGDKRVTGTQAELDTSARLRAERRSRNGAAAAEGASGDPDGADTRHTSGEITVGELRRARAAAGNHPLTPTAEHRSVDRVATRGAQVHDTAADPRYGRAPGQSPRRPGSEHRDGQDRGPQDQAVQGREARRPAPGTGSSPAPAGPDAQRAPERQRGTESQRGTEGQRERDAAPPSFDPRGPVTGTHQVRDDGRTPEDGTAGDGADEPPADDR
ncbi:MAG: AI-2E family transporter [Actinomycetaceae bacterium]